MLGWHLREIVVRISWHSRQSVFSGLSFAGVCPGPNFAEFQKTRAGGPLGKFDIARLHGHFGRRSLQQNVVLGWIFKEMLPRTWWHSRQGVFFGLLFAGVFPGPNFAEFQKTRARGRLGKFDIARLHGHFGRRSLQQNVVLGWHLKKMLIRTWWYLRQGVFCGLLFAGVSPNPNFGEFQKTRAKGPLGKFDVARLYGHFGSHGLQQNVVLGWNFKEILNNTWWHSRQGVFLWPSFCRSFLCSQLYRIWENERWGSPWQIWRSSASRALWKPRFAAKCCARLALEGNLS